MKADDVTVKAQRDWRPGQTRSLHLNKQVADWKVVITIGRQAFYSAQVYLDKSSATRAAKKVREKLNATQTNQIET